MRAVGLVGYQYAAARQREREQAVPRPARVRFFVLMEGVGELRLQGDQALQFGAFLMEEPTFSFGARVLHPLAAGGLPQFTATVLDYTINDLGLYVGAAVGLRADSTDPAIRLRCSLTFEALALRTTSVQSEATA